MSRHYSCWPVSVARPVRSLFLSLLVRFTEGNVSALRHYGIPENERGREIRSWNRPDDIRTALSWINWNSFRGTDGGIGRPVRLIDSALWLLPDTHSRTAMLEWHGRIVQPTIYVKDSSGWLRFYGKKRVSLIFILVSVYTLHLLIITVIAVRVRRNQNNQNNDYIVVHRKFNETLH